MRRRSAVLAASAGGLLFLHLIGNGDLAVPSLGSAAELREWLDGTDPVVAVFALLRLAAMAAGWYVVALAALGVVASKSHRPRLTRLLDAITLPALRPALGGATLGALVVVSGAMVTPVGAEPGVQPSDVLVEITADAQRRADPPTTSTPSTTPSTPSTATTLGPTEAPPTMRAVEPFDEHEPATSTTAVAPNDIDAGTDAGLDPSVEALDSAAPVTMRRLDTAGPALASPPSAPTTTPTAPLPATDGTWTIGPGESFWSVARDHLTDAWGRVPDDAEVDPYWRALIAANPDASPTGDPDLVYAGTVLLLPPV